MNLVIECIRGIQIFIYLKENISKTHTPFKINSRFNSNLYKINTNIIKHIFYKYTDFLLHLLIEGSLVVRVDRKSVSTLKSSTPTKNSPRLYPTHMLFFFSVISSAHSVSLWPNALNNKPKSQITLTVHLLIPIKCNKTRYIADPLFLISSQVNIGEIRPPNFLGNETSGPKLPLN